MFRAVRGIIKHKMKTKPQKLWVYLALLAAVFAGLAALAKQPGLSPAEMSVFRAINNLSEALGWPMLIITQFGSLAALFLAVVFCALARHRALAFRIFLLGGLTYLAVIIAKTLIARPRPGLLLQDVFDREIIVSGFGFPSGHTAIATIISVLLALHLKGKWRLLPFIWIPLVGVSRMYLGVHSPLDIVGGVCLALMVIVAFLLLKQGLRKNSKKAHV